MNNINKVKLKVIKDLLETTLAWNKAEIKELSQDKEKEMAFKYGATEQLLSMTNDQIELIIKKLNIIL